MDDFWGTPISIYTRAQAIEDGVLVDVTETAKEAGFRVPFAMTRAVWALIEPTAEERDGWMQSVEGRLWDVVWMARVGGGQVKPHGGAGGESKLYEVLFQMRGRDDYRSGTRKVMLKLHSGPGDNMEHVLTLMLPDED